MRLNPNVSFRQIRVFLAVAQERNFSRAGAQIGLSQPAVSRAIHELEDALDLRLFDRTTREVVLTEAGEMLAQRLPQWVDELDDILLELRHWAGMRRGKVRVASSPTLSASLLPLCLSECAVREPGIEVLLLDRIQSDVLASVLAGEVDIGVVVEPSQAQLADFHGETILTDPFVAVLPPDDEIVRQAGPVLSWQVLADRSLILLDQASGSRRLIDEALVRQGVPHRVVQQVGHAATAFEMVRAGLGCSVMPGLALSQAEVPGLVVRRLSPELTRRIMLVHRTNRHPAPLVECLRTLIKDCAGRVQRRREAWWR